MNILISQCWLWLVVFVIASAVVLSAARIILPQLDRYRVQVEQEVSRLIDQPVQIQAFELGWHGLGPRLYLQGLEIHNSDRELLFAFSDVHIDVDLWSSLLSGAVDFGAFTFNGLNLQLLRREDGSIGVEGIELGRGGGTQQVINQGKDETLAWLWRQGHLAVENSTIQLRDLSDNGRLWVFDALSLRLRNDGLNSHISGQVALPDQLGTELALVIDGVRDGESMADWTWQFYVNGEGLRSAQLASYFELPVQIRQGELAAKLWGEWRGGKLSDLRGDIALNRLVLNSLNNGKAERTHRLEHAEGQFVWQGDGQHWTLDIDRLRLGSEHGMTTRAQVSQHKSSTGLLFELGLSQVQAEQIVPLVLLVPGLPDKVKEPLIGLSPRGELSNVVFRWDTVGEQAPKAKPEYFLQAVLNNAGVEPWGKFPGGTGIEASLNMDQDSGLIDLLSEEVIYNSAGMFRDSLPIGVLQGQIAWLKGDSGINVELRQVVLSNLDVLGDVEGQIYVPFDRDLSPQLGLTVQVYTADVAALGQYLPVRIMKQGTIDWLDRAIVGGIMINAGVVIHGPLRKFPFRHREGRFEARLNVVDGILDFADDWPRIEEFDAQVLFDGDGMSIQANRAMTLASELRDVSASIESFKAHPPVLAITGKAVGDMSAVVRYVQEPPLLHDMFGDITSGLKASGASVLDLDIHLPLAEGDHTRVSGALSLDHGSLDFTQYDVDLAAVTGTIIFSEQGIQGDDVELVVMGQPAMASVATLGSGDSRFMVFEAQGVSDYRELATRLDYLPIFQYLRGQSDWAADLRVPEGKNDEPLTLNIKTNLVGTELVVPDPLGKQATVEQQFNLGGSIDDTGSRWWFDLGDNALNGIFDVPNEGDLRGELHLLGPAQLPESPGIRVAGHMAHFSEPDWFPVIFEEAESTGQAAGSNEASVNEVAITADTATIFSLDFDDLSVDAQRGGDIWVTKVESKQLAGTFNVPEEWSLPMSAQLKYWHLPAIEDMEEGEAVEVVEDTTDPAELPSAVIDSELFTYGGAPMGTLHLQTEQEPFGLRVSKLVIDGRSTVMNAIGSWHLIDGQHISTLTASLDIRDMGALLTALGFAATVDKGTGSSEFSLSWAAPLYAPDLALFNGMSELDIDDGKVLDVDPGAGRLLGLFSAQALPRRLLGDFRDLGTGFAFDNMKGQFTMIDGNAYVDSFLMKGPAADVTMTGRIGLGVEDYDQKLTVFPHVTSSLPLWGVVAAGGGLGVGAAVLLVERILKPVIDDVTQIRYSVTGSWDEPVITEIKE